jgi:antitoxin component HigA of HigAB toxin-antitoxin module
MANDEARIRAALKNPVPDELRAVPSFLARLHRSRGNSYCRIGEYAAAEAEYAAGFSYAAYEDRGDYLLDWAMASVLKLFLPSTPPEKRAACLRCIHVLEAANEQAGFTPDAPYLLASTNAIRAFVHMYLGDQKHAEAHLKAISPPTLPPGAQTDPGLSSFFTQLPKGIAAALELRDGVVLGALCATALTGHEHTRVDTSSLSVGQQLVHVLSCRRDVPKFHDNWWALVRHASALAPRFPVLRQFAKRMETGVDPARVATFVDSACR